MSEPLFVKSNVRDYLKNKGCIMSNEILDGEALNDIIKNILDKAAKRALTNGRKTVKPTDL